MSNPTFPLDPADIPALKRWLAAQDDPSASLRPIDIDEILIGPDVLLELPAALRRAGVAPGARVLLVVDEVPMRREQQDLKPFVQALLRDAGYEVKPLRLKGDQNGLVHADFGQVERVHRAIEPGSALVALGSGTVTDIVKHAAYLYDQQHPGQPRVAYICCPTANSVTAYAASMAVLLKDGVKRTIPSRYPTAILADLRVLASAPTAMTLAGLGDCCARFVAYGDWYLASALGLVDFYSEVPLALLENLDAILLEYASRIGQRTHDGEAVVMQALLLAGIAQSIVNMSAPISGTEHVTSHVLDMIAEHYHRPLALHGAQVGVATITAADLYQHFLDHFDPALVDIDACYPANEPLQAHILHLFERIDPSGAMARECWSDYSQKLALWRQQRPRFAQFCAGWQAQYRPKLASLVRSPRIVQRILAEAGAPLTCQQLDPPVSEEEYHFAVQNGHFIRVRFVLGDLLYFLGWH
ncbi:MAG TPA: iron-containing alcohol dehydrogenase [Ktedonobacteraceae bacterium]|nr:iron-containing alcohol dehydrogenase [Ktedonobacteraceae bacterium]